MTWPDWPLDLVRLSGQPCVEIGVAESHVPCLTPPPEVEAGLATVELAFPVFFDGDDVLLPARKMAEQVLEEERMRQPNR